MLATAIVSKFKAPVSSKPWMSAITKVRTPQPVAVEKPVSEKSRLPVKARPVSDAKSFELSCVFGPGFGQGEMLVRRDKKTGDMVILEAMLPNPYEAKKVGSDQRFVRIHDNVADERYEHQIVQMHIDAYDNRPRVQTLPLTTPENADLVMPSPNEESGLELLPAVAYVNDPPPARQHWLPFSELMKQMVVTTWWAQQQVEKFCGVKISMIKGHNETPPPAPVKKKLHDAPAPVTPYTPKRFYHGLFQDVSLSAIYHAVEPKPLRKHKGRNKHKGANRHRPGND